MARWMGRWGALLTLVLMAGQAWLMTGLRAAGESEAVVVEVLDHNWKPDEVWERIGKTKYIWHARVRNNSDSRQRVFVYYDLLGEGDVPLARTVTNRYLDPHESADIEADSYIESTALPLVTGSRVTLRVRAHP